jgi:hypothetical protein
MGQLLLQIALTTLAFIMTPDSALAVQAHGDSEGLVSHQIGHVLFALGMAYLLVRLQRFRKSTAGWREFRAFLWLLLAWNLFTFVGHWLNEGIDKNKLFRVDGEVVSFSITNLGEALFYVTRLDHLLLVPCFVFLLLALRRWGQA